MRIVMRRILEDEYPMGSGNMIPYVEEVGEEMNTQDLAEDALIEVSRLQRQALCWYCESEDGKIETDNNGPIVNCPMCHQHQFFQNSPPNI